VLSKSKGVDIAALHEQVLIAARGKVRLLSAEEYADRDLDVGEGTRRGGVPPPRLTAWEGCLRMVWHLSGVEQSGGISGCADVARAMRDSESARRLARVLYAFYDARGDAVGASRYNNLVTEWQYIWHSLGSPAQLRAAL